MRSCFSQVPTVVMGWSLPTATPWTPIPLSSCRLVLIWEGGKTLPWEQEGGVVVPGQLLGMGAAWFLTAL